MARGTTTAVVKAVDAGCVVVRGGQLGTADCQWKPSRVQSNKRRTAYKEVMTRYGFNTRRGRTSGVDAPLTHQVLRLVDLIHSCVVIDPDQLADHPVSGVPPLMDSIQSDVPDAH